MKNIFKALVVILMLLLVGCGEEEKEPTPVDNKEYVNVIIDGKANIAEKGVILEDYLMSLYGDTYLEKEDYDFKGWYSDIDLKEEIVDLNIRLENNYYLYSKYIHQAIRIENLISFAQDNMEVTLDQDLYFISPSYLYGISRFDLSDYKTFLVSYDMKIKDYVVINEDEERLPYDGFLVLVKNDAEKYDGYCDCFETGKMIYLNNYNIDYSSFVLLILWV